MTLGNARVLLRRPLKFGDPYQIAAVRTIECYEKSVETDAKCPACNGSGVVECTCSECEDVHDRECRDCDGSGYVCGYNIEETRHPDPRQMWLFPEMIPLSPRVIQ